MSIGKKDFFERALSSVSYIVEDNFASTHKQETQSEVKERFSKTPAHFIHY